MTKTLVRLGAISALVLAVCGWGALGAMWEVIWQTLVEFLPHLRTVYAVFCIKNKDTPCPCFFGIYGWREAVFSK